MYSEEETLRINLHQYAIDTFLFDEYTDDSRKNDIKHLIIVQEYYDGYRPDNMTSTLVTIPKTISNLTEVESITIHACVSKRHREA